MAGNSKLEKEPTGIPDCWVMVQNLQARAREAEAEKKRLANPSVTSDPVAAVDAEPVINLTGAEEDLLATLDESVDPSDLKDQEMVQKEAVARAEAEVKHAKDVRVFTGADAVVNLTAHFLDIGQRSGDSHPWCPPGVLPVMWSSLAVNIPVCSDQFAASVHPNPSAP